MTFKNCLSIIAVSLSIILSATSCTGGGGGSNDASGGNNPAQKQQGNNSGFKYDISGTWISTDKTKTLRAELLPPIALDALKKTPNSPEDVKNAQYGYTVTFDSSRTSTYLTPGSNMFNCMGNQAGWPTLLLVNENKELDVTENNTSTTYIRQ